MMQLWMLRWCYVEPLQPPSHTRLTELTNQGSHCHSSTYSSLWDECCTGQDWVLTRNRPGLGALHTSIPPWSISYQGIIRQPARVRERERRRDLVQLLALFRTSQLGQFCRTVLHFNLTSSETELGVNCPTGPVCLSSPCVSWEILLEL